MQSEADIIYNHIVGSCNDNIEKIELGGDANLPHILSQYKYKTTNRIFDRAIEKEEAMKKADLNSVILMPYFLKECSKREKELGINITKYRIYMLKTIKLIKEVEGLKGTVHDHGRKPQYC